MPQFLINPENILGDRFEINGAEAKHISRVLRIRRGEKIYLAALEAPGVAGKRFLGVVEQVGKDRVAGKILKEVASDAPDSRIRIFAALIKPDRFEIMLEKLTEIGVDEIIPLVTQRTAKAHAAAAQKKAERWAKILFSAAKQCSCRKIPLLAKPVAFTKALALADKKDVNAIAWEHYLDEHVASGGMPLTPAEIARKHRNAASGSYLNLFFGPEGGFTNEEIELARNRSFMTFTLGRNIMRAETAVIVAAGSAMLAALEK